MGEIVDFQKHRDSKISNREHIKKEVLEQYKRIEEQINEIGDIILAHESSKEE